MIVGKEKPLSEIKEMLKDYKKVLVAGCGTCVTVTLSGGRKEVALLSSALRMAANIEGRKLEVREDVAPRQCEARFLEKLDGNIKWAEAILSLACGVGVQTMAEVYPGKKVLPGLNTMMIGRHFEDWVFKEYCGACGDCVLDETGGICPIVRCSKSMLNGPCGGSKNGKCEVSKEIDCGWQLIYDKLKELKRMGDWTVNRAPKDWRSSWHGGPRTVKKGSSEQTED